MELAQLKKRRWGDVWMGRVYQQPDYYVLLMDVLVARDRQLVKDTPSWHLRLGSGPDCILLNDGERYLSGEAGLIKQHQVERHLAWCHEGCKEALDLAVQQEIERERLELPDYVENIGVRRARIERCLPLSDLRHYFPLVNRYRSQLWDPLLEQLDPSDS